MLTTETTHQVAKNNYTLIGIECAEKIITTLDLTESGNCFSSSTIRSVTVLIRNGWTGHLSIKLHLTDFGNDLADKIKYFYSRTPITILRGLFTI